MSRELCSVAGLRGQESALRAFSAALADGEDGGPARVAGAYLLHGPEGVGRGMGAAGFATALLCANPRGLEPCGECKACGWNAAGTHPDLRGKGIGGILLKRCLQDMKDWELETSIIPWVGPIRFYSYYANAVVNRVFWRYEKKL